MAKSGWPRADIIAALGVFVAAVGSISAVVAVPGLHDFVFGGTKSVYFCSSSNPAEITMKATGRSYRIFHGGDVNLEQCVIKNGLFDCSFFLKSTTAGVFTFEHNPTDPGWQSVLIDDHDHEHTQVYGSLLDKDCKPIDRMQMLQGDWVRFTQRFAGPTDGVKPARIVFPQTAWGTIVLRDRTGFLN